MATGERRPDVILVTGCSTGLGRGLCVVLSRRPNTLVVATARNIASLADLVESNKAIVPLQLDVSDDESVRQAIQKASVLGGGHIYGVVCNAGVSCFGPLAFQPVEEVNKIMDTNVHGVVRTVQAAFPYMAEPKAKGGRIVIIGSVSATLVTPFAGAYCASKAAVHAISDALRIELKPFGISVTTVHAGSIKSAFSSNAESGSSLSEYANTVYNPVLSAIKARIWASQDGAMEAEDVSAQIVDRCFSTLPAPSMMTAANNARRFLCFGFLQKWIATAYMDGVLSSKFGLASLNV